MTPGMVRQLAFILAAVAATAAGQQSSSTSTGQAQEPNIAGVWVLNPALTQKPAEIGFSRDWARAAGPGGEGAGARPGGGGRGRRGGGSGGGSMGAAPMSHESADDSTRLQQLTEAARTAPEPITIVQKPTSVSIADDQGHSRTFHPDGHQEELTIGTIALPTTARWDSGGLVVVYDVEAGRQLRYTFTPTSNPTQLQVNIRF